MKVKDFWCPNCGEKGLHPYNNKGERPKYTDDIDELWCLYCNFKITCKDKKKGNC